MCDAVILKSDPEVGFALSVVMDILDFRRGCQPNLLNIPPCLGPSLGSQGGFAQTFRPEASNPVRKNVEAMDVEIVSISPMVRLYV